MCFFANTDNNTIIHISEFTKTKLKNTFCVGCGEEIYPIFATKIQSHFRHKRHEYICEYERLFYQNKSKYYDYEFHKKWTIYLIKNQYLFRYWYNENIADIYKDNITIIIRDKLLEKKEIEKYEKRSNEKDQVIFLLNYERRPIDIYQFKSMYFLYSKNGNYYDLPLYNFNKTEVYIDYKSSFMLKLTGKYYPLFGYQIDIENINKFIQKQLNNVCKTEFKIGNEEIKMQYFENTDDLKEREKIINQYIESFKKIVYHIDHLGKKIKNNLDTDRIMCFLYHFKNQKGEVFFTKKFIVEMNSDEIYSQKITYIIFEKLIEWIIFDKIQHIIYYEKLEISIYMKNDNKNHDIYTFIINNVVFEQYKEKMIFYFDDILHKKIHKMML